MPTQVSLWAVHAVDRFDAVQRLCAMAADCYRRRTESTALTWRGVGSPSLACDADISDNSVSKQRRRMGGCDEADRILRVTHCNYGVNVKEKNTNFIRRSVLTPLVETYSKLG